MFCCLWYQKLCCGQALDKVPWASWQPEPPTGLRDHNWLLSNWVPRLWAACKEQVIAMLQDDSESTCQKTAWCVGADLCQQEASLMRSHASPLRRRDVRLQDVTIFCRTRTELSHQNGSGSVRVLAGHPHHHHHHHHPALLLLRWCSLWPLIIHDHSPNSSFPLSSLLLLLSSSLLSSLTSVVACVQSMMYCCRHLLLEQLKLHKPELAASVPDSCCIKHEWQARPGGHTCRGCQDSWWQNSNIFSNCWSYLTRGPLALPAGCLSIFAWEESHSSVSIVLCLLSMNPQLHWLSSLTASSFGHCRGVFPWTST